jgi:flagellar motor switch protein FliN
MSDPEDTDLTVEEEDPWAEAMEEQSAEEDSAEEEEEEEDDPWAEAMEEQSAEEEPAEEEPAEEEAADEEPVADAAPEQADDSSTDKTTATVTEEKKPVAAPTPKPTPAPNAKAASEKVFKPLNTGVSQAAPRELEMIMDIPVKLYVELGRTRITIKQLLELTQGSVVELEGLAGDPMDILINGHLIAQGEVVVVDEKYGIRVTEIITPSERAQKLNQ